MHVREKQLHAGAPVSIHTRHFCRVMRGAGRHRRKRRCFNPHPTFLPGDAWLVQSSARFRRSFNPHPTFLPGDALQVGCVGFLGCLVSIHTRHFCRVMPHADAGELVGKEVSIHTRHFCRVML